MTTITQMIFMNWWCHIPTTWTAITLG